MAMTDWERQLDMDWEDAFTRSQEEDEPDEDEEVQPDWDSVNDDILTGLIKVEGR